MKTRPCRIATFVATAVLASITLAQQETTTPSSPALPGLYHGLADMKNTATREIAPGFHTRVLIEAEASYLRQSDFEFSDTALSLFQLTANIDLPDDIRGHTVLLWEPESSESLDLDEATLRVGGVENNPWYVEGGKRYIPFGAFNTHFVSRPLSLQLAATHETTLLGGYTTRALTLQAGIFNGALDRDMTDFEDGLDDIFASLTWTPSPAFEAGMSWTSDFGESDMIQQSLFFEAIGYKRASGIGATLSASLGPVHIDAEVVAAADDISVLGNVIPVNTPLTNDTIYVRSFQPVAWNTELAVRIAQQWLLAVKAEGSDEFDVLPEFRWGPGLVYAINASATVKIEYLAAEFAGSPDAQTAVVQLAAGF